MRVYISGKIGEAVVSEATRQKFAKEGLCVDCVEAELFYQETMKGL